MGSLAKGSLRKVCGNSAEILRKVRGQYVLLCQERVRKFCGKFAEISRKFFCNDPFPNDPISVVLKESKNVQMDAAVLGGQTAGGHPKASARPLQPLFAVPAFRELENGLGTTLTLQPLLFSISLLFLFSDFPCFFLCFSFLFQGFLGFREEKNPCFLGENPCFFQKSKGWRVRENSPGKDPCYIKIVLSFRKILAPIKIKSALPPPPPKPNSPPPPKTKNFMDMEGFPAERRHFSMCP